MREGRIERDEWEMNFYELALKASGAVQAARWSGVAVREPSPHAANSSQLGYIYSFNGPHSLFVDTMRTLRILGVAWQLGQSSGMKAIGAPICSSGPFCTGFARTNHLIFHGDTLSFL